jgi:adenine phosphoribosyltransferase
MNIEKITAAIRDIPDFPQPGIVFKDIAPVLSDPDVFRASVDLFVERHKEAALDKIAVIEARGFLFGAAVAYQLGVGIALVRKKGKLPFTTVEATYDLEYGSAAVEMHTDAVAAGERVLLLDDLLATGGTAVAAAGLIEDLGATVVEVDFLIELSFLDGREKLKGYEVFAPVVY